MLTGIEKNNEVLKADWPRAKTAVIYRPKKILNLGLVGDVYRSKISDEKIANKNNNTGFDNLDEKILSIIFTHFNEKELFSNICRVSRHWYNVARNPKLWKELEFKGNTTFKHIKNNLANAYLYSIFYQAQNACNIFKPEKTDTATKCNFLWKSPKLERLSLNDMENPLTVIRQMCRCNRFLKHLKIKNCRGGQSERIPESVLRNILHSCRKLESLDLNGTQFSGTRFYHELANLPNLRKLNLNNSKYLLAKDLVTIALNCRNLEDISITRAEDSLSSINSLQISDQDAVFFFKNLSHSLKRVEFDTTGLTGPSFEAILSCRYLKRLSLRHTLFLSSEIFCYHLSKLRGLKQLRLTQACQLVSEDLILLSEKRVFDHLNLLDLSGSGRITDIGLRSLLQCCKDRLTYLNLKSCKSIKDVNFIINNCTKLQYLNIAHSLSLEPSHTKNLASNIQKLGKLVIDDKTLPNGDFEALLSRAPELKLIRSMSEFHKDELPVCLKEARDVL